MAIQIIQLSPHDVLLFTVPSRQIKHMLAYTRPIGKRLGTTILLASPETNPTILRGNPPSDQPGDTPEAIPTTPEDTEIPTEILDSLSQITGRGHEEVKTALKSLHQAFRLAEGKLKAEAIDTETTQGTEHPCQSVSIRGSSLPQPEPTEDNLEEVREITALGRDPKSGLWIFGDCAFTPDGQALFPDEDHIIWHNGTGYRIDPDDLANFAHKTPPRLFQHESKTPQEIHAEITADPYTEAREVARIFLQQSADFIASFGGIGGLLAIGQALSYAAAPEIIARCGGHPGLWLHGRMAAGKSEIARLLMMTWGYDAGFRTMASGGGTSSASIDRFLAQYSDIPVHIDEFRDDSQATNHSLRACFNKQATAKGTLDGVGIRSIRPLTSPLITGEGITNDPALLSRYVILELSKEARFGNPAQQKERYDRICRDAKGYHRIIRYIMRHRERFAAALIENLNGFLADEKAIAAIPQRRIRICYGIAWAAWQSLYQETKRMEIGGQDQAMLRQHATTFRETVLSYVSGMGNEPPAPPTPEPELPPLGHDLTFPKDAEEIHHLGHKHIPVLRALARDTDLEGEDLRECLNQYRRIARQHGRRDIELFDCILAWSRLNRSGHSLLEAVSTSLAAAQTAEIAPE
jgi:hypothetical protein